MKYLKKFNETISESDYEIIKDELQTIANNYLAYLIDDDFIITVNEDNEVINTKFTTHNTYSGGFKLNIRKDENTINDFFIFDDIKDYIIPFINYLSEYYDIYQFRLYNKMFFTYKFNNLEYFEKEIEENLETQYYALSLFLIKVS